MLNLILFIFLKEAVKKCDKSGIRKFTKNTSSGYSEIEVIHCGKKTSARIYFQIQYKTLIPVISKSFLLKCNITYKHQWHHNNCLK